ncbi:DUF3043 domain-containing protein [Corynebacterium breve]|uniref:DUF3043 domain-containing protein n=1 Tax=Corynebacterium breve TaxID=3049799 RepID=A0ABY8VCF4_9CORY|nr:DUF3043 domain-containing protein [Corynebacterium breve]WIM67002.1 DUF3043 domain-containing protein [Corynebacterium breve]
MKLPWQKSEDAPEQDATNAASGSTAVSAASADSADSPEQQKLPKGYTPPKGKPTPKRREQEIARGVVRDPDALSSAEAAQRHKELKKSMSKEEWKEYKRKNREENRERNRQVQARMDAGDERYLMDRDRGEVRRYVRDWVDSKRHVTNWVMPMALVLLVIMVLGQWYPVVANIVSFLTLFLIAGMIAEGIFIGRGANKAVRKKFPNTTEAGFGLGMYAYNRATQPRKWRTPKPQVEIGDTV